MASNVNLKELWNKQTAHVPDTKELFEKVNKYRKKNLIMLIRTNILLILTSVFIIWVVYNYKPNPIFSTKVIGTSLVIAAMALYLAVYNRMIPLLRKVKEDMSSQQYLQNLLKIKAKQKFLQTTMMNLYYILLSTGMFLYMIDPAMHMPLSWLLITYGLTFGWIAFSWFYFRKRAIRKQEKAMNELIEKFEGIGKQLEE